jgi:septal ring factor EnvC (AmiA/AmiB activator)
MEITEAIKNALRDLISPELDRIKEEGREIKALLSLTNKRLDDVNLHLADQSRRIDALREELSQRIDQTNNRLDETNKRMDRLYEVILRREEHVTVVERVAVLEREVNELKRRLAA